jgi:hypothetical protein
VCVTLKTVWFILHRIREAMTTLGLEPMGGAGSVVEIDEPSSAKRKAFRSVVGYAHKHSVMTLIERRPEVAAPGRWPLVHRNRALLARTVHRNPAQSAVTKPMKCRRGLLTRLRYHERASL